MTGRCWRRASSAGQYYHSNLERLRVVIKVAVPKAANTMTTSARILMATVCFSACELSRASQAQPQALRCEYRVNPLGIDEAQPRLTWRIESNERGQRQTAYRILVASSEAALMQNNGELSDSGVI